MAEGYRTHILSHWPQGVSGTWEMTAQILSMDFHFHLHTNCLELCSLNLEVRGSCSALCFVAVGPEIFSGAVSLGWVSWLQRFRAEHELPTELDFCCLLFSFLSEAM